MFVDFLKSSVNETKVTTSGKGGIRVDGIQTGWSVEKDGNSWNLLDFDDEIIFTASSKKLVIDHYKTWYIH